jgi:hypothetical protein
LVSLGAGFTRLAVGGGWGGAAPLRVVQSCQQLALADALQIQVSIVVFAVVMLVMVRGRRAETEIETVVRIMIAHAHAVPTAACSALSCPEGSLKHSSFKTEIKFNV